MLTDMIVRPQFGEDGELLHFVVKRASREFVVIKGERGNWETYDRDALTDSMVSATREGSPFDVTPTLDVAGDFADSLEYIDGLFR